MDILFKSVSGGILIAIILFSAKFFGPKIAGILTAIPMVFTTSFLFGFIKKEEIVIQNFVWNVFISAIITSIFLGSFYFLNQFNFKIIWINLIISYLIYFLLIYFAFFYFKK